MRWLQPGFFDLPSTINTPGLLLGNGKQCADASSPAPCRGCSRTFLLRILQEAALTRVTKMRDVFNSSFGLDEHGTPRTWRPRDNIPQLARQARREAARVLALLVSTCGCCD